MEPIVFGTTPTGREVHLWHLTNTHGMSADICDLGACLVSLYIPDPHNKDQLVDVVLGYGNAAAYSLNTPNFGAVVGRCANRIANANFTLGSTTYQLVANEHNNTLHSGPDLWTHRIWKCADAHTNRLELYLQSPDGDQGFPGALEMHVTYELTQTNILQITYAAVPDAPTLINITNHSYFNLNGHASGSALAHILRVFADTYTEMDDQLIPTGKILSVAHTPLDLRSPQPLEPGVTSKFPAITLAHGYDHNYVLDDYQPQILRRVATLVGDKTGIAMDVITDTPGLQVYTANYIDGERGKDSTTYHNHDAVCLETQFFPDAIHHQNFAQPVFDPGHPYQSCTQFAFML